MSGFGTSLAKWIQATFTPLGNTGRHEPPPPPPAAPAPPPPACACGHDATRRPVGSVSGAAEGVVGCTARRCARHALAEARTITTTPSRALCLIASTLVSCPPKRFKRPAGTERRSHARV